MTKQQEIDALKNFIQSLPHDSYLRPWLTDILPGIERDIAGDILPFISPQDLREEAIRQREEHKAQLAALHTERERQQENTRTESERIISDAKKRAEEIENTARRTLSADISRLQYALSNLSI